VNGRTLGILKRLGVVVGVLLYWHLVTRATLYVDDSITLRDPIAPRDIRRPFFSNDLIGHDWIDWAMAHALGLLVGLLAGGILYLIYVAIMWVIEGPSPYVDPCTDPKCPCARHEKERQDAEDARTVATAALTAAVVSTIIN